MISVHGERGEKMDLIDRQAAIDAFYTLTSDGDLIEWCEYVLKTVPSAQIEQRWIPCSERLPEENVPVLLGVRYKDDFKMFVTARMDVTYWQGLGRNIIGEMRWMPLPEPYQEE